jgi:hypothetical protein
VDFTVHADDDWVFSRSSGPAHDSGAPVYLAPDPATLRPFPVSPTGHDANLYLEVFRLNGTKVAQHVGRAVFNGRFNGLELDRAQLSYAQSTYGPDAQALLPLWPDGDIFWTWFQDGPHLIPQAGAMETPPADPAKGPGQTLPLLPLITPPIRSASFYRTPTISSMLQTGTSFRTTTAATSIVATSSASVTGVSTFSITRSRGCSGTNLLPAASTRYMTPIFNSTRTRLTPTMSSVSTPPIYRS